MPTYEPVTAILRGLAVLETIAAKGPVAIKDLHAATGLPKSTLVRLIETLIHAGYVYSTGSEPLYALSARSLTLAGGFDRGRRITPGVTRRNGKPEDDDDNHRAQLRGHWENSYCASRWR